MPAIIQKEKSCHLLDGIDQDLVTLSRSVVRKCSNVVIVSILYIREEKWVQTGEKRAFHGGFVTRQRNTL